MDDPTAHHVRDRAKDSRICGKIHSGDTGAKHNAILERPTLLEMRVVILIFHLTMKFPTPEGVRHINGQQGDARKWYKRSLE